MPDSSLIWGGVGNTRETPPCRQRSDTCPAGSKPSVSAAHVSTRENGFIIKIILDIQLRFSDTRIVGRKTRAMMAPPGKPMHGRDLLGPCVPEAIAKGHAA